MSEQIVIGTRFNGPPESGNGGYTAGLVAAALRNDATDTVVTLRQPPPLATPLRVDVTEAQVAVYDGDLLIAEGAPAVLDEPAVAPVTLTEAAAAAEAYAGFSDHPFPTCYVCGPGREDGLGIFPGPHAPGRTAAPWQVPEDVTTATVWGALDCPGGWSIIGPGRPYVLGRMTARVLAMPPSGSQCVVTGAVGEVEGRKATVRSAVYTDTGELLAQARAIWIAIDK